MTPFDVVVWAFIIVALLAIFFIGVAIMDLYLDYRIGETTTRVFVQLADSGVFRDVMYDDQVKDLTCQDCLFNNNPEAECWNSETWNKYGSDCPNFKEIEE